MKKNRIDKIFQEKHANGEKVLIFFITAGFPDWKTNEKIIHALAESGCDVLELGVPFSDPIADGPTIQRSSERALQAGVSLKKILKHVKSLRAKVDIPIVLFSALNPLLKYGLEKLVDDADDAGVDGILSPDLPPEEAEDLAGFCRKKGLSLIFLVAPTTTDERRAFIVEKSTGFVYYVSLKGVTGARKEVSTDLDEHIQNLKKITEKPVVVGFGISTPEHVRHVAGTTADGVVIGSALINLVEKCEHGEGLIGEVRRYVGSLRDALKIKE